MNYLVSVVIPVYKVEKYIRRCVDSIINQTYKNLEIILVDDGSPDTCPTICDDYCSIDKRIQVIHQENKGLSAARNTGIRAMSGEFVVFVDSDDFMNRYAIERWIKLQNEYDADIVIGEFIDFYGEKSIKIDSENEVQKVQLFNSSQVLEYMFLENERICVAWGKLYKVDLFNDKQYPEDIFFAEDMFLAYKLFFDANIIVLDTKIAYYYNQEGTSLVRSVYKVDKLNRIEATKEWMDFAEKNFPKILDAAIYRYAINLVNECSLLIDEPGFVDALNQIIQKLCDNYQVIKSNPYLSRKDKIKVFLLKNKLLGAYGGLRKILGR